MKKRMMVTTRGRGHNLGDTRGRFLERWQWHVWAHNTQQKKLVFPFLIPTSMERVIQMFALKLLIIVKFVYRTK